MSQRLLLADDSVTIRRVIELTFADENVRVESVSSGRAAMASIEAAPPDIILADAGMPDVSGYDIAAFVKGRPDLRHIPVILLAGAFEPLDEARSRKSGSDGVLVKPFEPQMVVARVRELLPAPDARQYTPPRPRTEMEDDIRGIAEPSAPPALGAPGTEMPLNPTPQAVDPLFDESLDRLDAAFATTTDVQAPALDSSTATEFANDLRALRSGRIDSGGFERQDFGDWDLPVRPPAELDAMSAREPEAAADVFSAPAPEPVVPPLPPPVALAPKTAPVPPPSAPLRPAPVPALLAPVVTPVAPLADAFSNLLAAEEGRPHAPLRMAVADALPVTAQLTDADMDLIVDKVISRLGSGVRGAVIDLAERLVKAEIDRLKALR
ncbi:MAG TPA: response regulator [Vicinamibacterales bacterium]|nr:response regulator [Vicinamibacterales bacterium]